MHKIPTAFAPAERSDQKKVRQQATIVTEFIITSDPVKRILDMVPDGVMVLNKERQIVFVNISLLKTLGINDPASVLGLRPGEALACVHSRETEGGCGTTEYCTNCGAVLSILAAQEGRTVNKECHIMLENGKALDLAVGASPVDIRGERYTILTAIDISSEKRRRVLERTFFHDILNTTGALLGYAEIMRDFDPSKQKDFAMKLFKVTTVLIDEIQSQRQLLAAENDELKLNMKEISSNDLIRMAVAAYQAHPVGHEKKIMMDSESPDIMFSSDEAILGRVIGNMLKNALEASEKNQTVKIGCRPSGDNIEFYVNNATVMPREVQLQMFMRSFSTKGAGRGIGTYSMKLLTEKYLGGKISFTSDEKNGTTFTVSIPMKR